MAESGPLEPKELLAQAEKYLLTVPEAARMLQEVDSDQAWYQVKLWRLIQAGDLQAVRVGGEHSEGYHLVDRREVDSLVEEGKRTAEDDSEEG